MTELRFTPDHEWVRLDGSTATVGITDHAQTALGDVVFVDLPEVGRVVTQGEPCAVVESVKAASDIFAPLAGRIIEVNTALADNPAVINSEPTGAGWFFKMEPEDPSLVASLLDAEAYAALVESLA
jgi:glycine cleavage system H protein